MRFDILTIFPEMFDSPFQASLIGKARERGVIEVRIVNIREFAEGRHHVTDDYPFGGGEGMVMKPEPIVRAIESVHGESPDARVVLLTPQGKVFDHGRAVKMASRSHWILVCGRYEGVDQRVIDGGWIDEELSIGDYVLAGGETAAVTVIEAAARLVPGVMGNAVSLAEESHTAGRLEYPHYTRPREFRGMDIPDVLLSGHHAEIARWRRIASLRLTRDRRPDLLERHPMTDDERKLLDSE